MIIPDIDQQQLASWLVTNWRRLKDERSQKESIWQECWLAYTSKFGQTWQEIAEYRSKRYIPISKLAVESVSAHLTQGVMPHDDWFNILGRTPDDERGAKYMTALMKWQHFRTGWRKQFASILKQAAIFGCVPWAVLWKQDVRWVPDPEQHGENMGAYAAAVESGAAQAGVPPPVPLKPIRKYDGPEIVAGNIFDFVIDRNGNDEYALRISRYFKTKAYLRQMAEPDAMGYALYQNVESINNESPYKETSDGIRRQVDAEMGFYDIPKDRVELLEAWGDFEIDGETYHNHVLVVANRTTVLRFEPNPYAHGRIPWQMFVLQPDPIEVYGNGILEPALGLQDVVNVRINQIIEGNALTVNPQLQVVNDGTVDLENFISAPGAIHLVSQIGNIAPLQMAGKPELGMSEVGFMMAQFNQSTGAMQSFSTEDYQKSATEISAQAGMTNSRFSESIRHIESTFVVPALEMQLELNQQMMDQATWIRVVEPQFNPQDIDPMTGMPRMYDPVGPAPMQIMPDDIRGEFDIYPVGASWVANNREALAQMIQLTQVIAQSPAAQVIKWNEFAKLAYEKANVRDAYRFIKSDGELIREWQMAMQAQQQMGGTGSWQGGADGSGGSSGGRGAASVAGAPGAQPGGGAGTGPQQQTNGGPQRVG